jgi:hypothetical protein
VAAMTERDTEILVALCTKVRLFTLDQVADGWWSHVANPKSLTRRRLGKLAEVELVKQQRVLAAPLPPMREPIIRWRPGDPAPDAGAVAWKLQTRWSTGAQPTTVFTSTPKSARLFGGKPSEKLKSNLQVTHDLGVSGMYLQLLRTDRSAAQQWIGEDILAPYRFRQKLPDAVLAERAGATPQLVLEFGGSYDKPRVQSFHDDCARRSLPYELW